MDFIYLLFGKGKDLDTLQMIDRGIAVFLIALVLIRIAGRRSFGLRTPFDNIIVVLLGAVLSRVVVGASPTVPVIAASLAIVIMHRLTGWLIVRYKVAGKIIEGNKILLFEKGKFLKKTAYIWSEMVR